MDKEYFFDNISGQVLISELLRSVGAGLGMPCGGRGVCGKCRVKVSGSVSVPSVAEQEKLTENELSSGVRLACMTYATGAVTVTVRADEYTVPYFEKSLGNTVCAQRMGAAVDIGTTSITVAVYDLDTDEILFSDTKLNPQNAFGADVISRLEKSLEGHGVELQRAVCTAITEPLSTLSISGKKLSGMVITGNTAMLYLLTGRNPGSITAAPFEADCLFGFELDSSALPGLESFGDFVYLPRCASAFVGADITCCALDAAERFDFLANDGKARLLADIGTNGELMLSVGGRLYCCSTAAGPAFEGATLHSGSVAKEGAIDSVVYRDGKILCTVIGDTEGVSICGSGIIDAVCVMLGAGIIDDTGLILPDGHAFGDYITECDEVFSFRIPGTQVIITQEDIRNIQLAKSAICAGMLTLISYAGVNISDIDELIIAGGFGGCINTKSAASIGLIPEELADKTVIAGNGALRGAHMILSSGEYAHSVDIANLAQTIDLSSNAKFFDEYIMGMTFNI